MFSQTNVSEKIIFPPPPTDAYEINVLKQKIVNDALDGKCHSVSAFTDVDANNGNPAGIIFIKDEETFLKLTDEVVVYAAETLFPTFSETAFVYLDEAEIIKSCQFYHDMSTQNSQTPPTVYVRFSTPTSPIDFCGHATCAVFGCLADKFGFGKHVWGLNKKFIMKHFTQNNTEQDSNCQLCDEEYGAFLVPGDKAFSKWNKLISAEREASQLKLKASLALSEKKNSEQKVPITRFVFIDIGVFVGNKARSSQKAVFLDQF